MEKETIIPKVTMQGLFFTLAVIAISVFALMYFEGIFKPIVIAFLIYFIINQLKNTFGRIRIGGKQPPHLVSNIFAFLIIFLVLYGVVELFIINLEGIVASMPEYLINLNNSYGDLTGLINDPETTQYLQKWIDELNLAGMATSVLNSLSGLVANSAVVLVYIIFFLMEDAIFRGKIQKLFPEKGKKYQKFLDNLNSINGSFRAYLSQKTLISIITGALSYVILLFMGVDFAFLWGFLIFLLNYIPYIGPLISSLIPAVFAVLAKGDLWQFVWVFLAMEGVQIVLGNFVEPYIMGKGTNLSPITVIVALAFWGMIWGLVGMILAVPITAVMVIIMGQSPSARYIAVMMSEKGELPENND
jgi:predicted PurR-regulated permease PerM